ncbi:MAG: DUF4249 domain-containing protein [Bacteroidetes bacterium]|nr:DUF4249 domain-containing protein [Bacteroidota bacterium]
MREASDMTIKQITGLMLLGIMTGWGCKKHYSPPAATANYNYLVVEGVISAGGDSTIIKLSRTIKISDADRKSHETGAKVTVNDDQGASYPLTETDSGRYAALPVSLNTSRKYKLNIVTADGKTYESDYVPVQVTPPIDSVGYDITATAVDIYLNTHDPSNQTKYYRWDYTETYIYESVMDDPLEFDNSYQAVSNKFRLRTPAQQVHVCYDNVNASTILLQSTANLKGSIINNYPITQIASTSEKIAYKYSILVKQYPITADAFNFWSQLKKNTEQIGTVFDALPSEVQGNIHCTSDPAEPVIGYVSASTVSQKRIFIGRTQLPVWPVSPPTDPCGFETLSWAGGNIPQDITGGVWIPVGALNASFNPHAEDSVYSVNLVLYNCVDCRFHNHGSNVKPAFWK